MAKLIIFFISLFTVSAVDIASMRKNNLKRELVPHVIIAVAAGFMAAQSVMADGAVMSYILRIFGGAV